MAGQIEVCCGAVGRSFREYLEAIVHRRCSCTASCACVDLSLFASRLRQYELIVCQRAAETGDCMQRAAHVSLASRIHNVRAALVADTKASLVLRSADSTVGLHTVSFEIAYKSRFIKDLASGPTALYFKIRTPKSFLFLPSSVSLAGSSVVAQSNLNHNDLLSCGGIATHHLLKPNKPFNKARMRVCHF